MCNFIFGQHPQQKNSYNEWEKGRGASGSDDGAEEGGV